MKISKCEETVRKGKFRPSIVKTFLHVENKKNNMKLKTQQLCQIQQTEDISKKQ